MVLDVTDTLPDGTQLAWPLDATGVPVVVADGQLRSRRSRRGPRPCCSLRMART